MGVHAQLSAQAAWGHGTLIDVRIEYFDDLAVSHADHVVDEHIHHAEKPIVVEGANITE